MSKNAEKKSLLINALFDRRIFPNQVAFCEKLTLEQLKSYLSGRGSLFCECGRLR